MKPILYGCQFNGDFSKRISFQYVDVPTPRCSQAIIATSAFRTLIRSIASASQRSGFRDEDGCFLYGFMTREGDGSLACCVTDIVDGGIQARRSPSTYCFDDQYVNHQAVFRGDLHADANFGALGMIHVHPSNMTVFSATDIATLTEKYLPECRVGFLSGLITFDEGLRLTMYFLVQNKEADITCHKVPTIVSDRMIAERIKRDRPRTLEEIWKSACGGAFPGTSIRICDEARPTLMGESAAPCAPATPGQRAAPASREAVRPQTNAADAAPASLDDLETLPANPVSAVVRLDLSGIPDGASGELRGSMKNGTLCLYLSNQGESIPEADAARPAPGESAASDPA